MPDIPVALVSETERLTGDELTRVAQALQRQLTEDVGPIWKIGATVHPFAKRTEVPSTYWPVTVRDKLEEGMWSIHSVEHGQPYVLVAYGEQWSMAASHDLMEMLTDPNVTRTARGPSPEPAKKYDVEFLLQICDPCAGSGYEIDGVRVAEFSLPSFWNAGARKGPYSFKGTLKKPFEIARGGYVTWRDRKAKRWRQQVWWDKAPKINDLGPMGPETAEGAESSAIVEATHARVYRFNAALRPVYKNTQAPLLGSARAIVEELIQRFS